jgi:hypothetical protein
MGIILQPFIFLLLCKPLIPETIKALNSREIEGKSNENVDKVLVISYQ